MSKIVYTADGEIDLDTIGGMTEQQQNNINKIPLIEESVNTLEQNFIGVRDGKNLLETSITNKGGTVSKATDVATFSELNDGIVSIPSKQTSTSITDLKATKTIEVNAYTIKETYNVKKSVYVDYDNIINLIENGGVAKFYNKGVYLFTLTPSPTYIIYGAIVKNNLIYVSEMSSSAYLVKCYDLNGILLWTSTTTSASTYIRHLHDYEHIIADNNNVYSLKFFNDGASSKLYINKYDLNGILLQSRNINISTSSTPFSNVIDKEFYLYFYDQANIRRINKSDLTNPNNINVGVNLLSMCESQNGIDIVRKDDTNNKILIITYDDNLVQLSSYNLDIDKLTLKYPGSSLSYYNFKEFNFDDGFIHGYYDGSTEPYASMEEFLFKDNVLIASKIYSPLELASNFVVLKNNNYYYKNGYYDKVYCSFSKIVRISQIKILDVPLN